MSGQMWTPAPKKGIIPLHPLTFGMLLGKAFAALRHNPKVLFGFAVVIQLIVVLATAGVMGVVLFTSFARLETVPVGSPDFEAVLAGTIAVNIVAGLVVGLASIAFTAIMQGVVAADIGYAAIGVKATLRMLWKKMTPAFWRLAGFSSLSVIAVFGLLAVVAVIIGAFIAGGLGGSAELIGVLVVVVILIALACVPLVVWLSTKLLLVPSVLVLEGARFREALVRSWRLTRGRFWVAWGVTFLISAIMGLAMQVVSVPVTLLSSLLGSVVAPTGATEPSAIVGYVFTLIAPQILLLVLQAITLVVQSTGSALVYLDCRMRYEGLDQTLISHVERRDLGWTDEQLGDPYVVDPSRAVSQAPPPRQVPEHVMMSTGYAYPPQYAAPAYPGPQQAAPSAPPYAGQQHPSQQYPGQQDPSYQYPGTATQPPAFAPAPPPISTAGTLPPAMPPAPSGRTWAPPADGAWTAPGADGDGSA
ncbi:glycerophosphoryl diester phosphodiesterase membrane domain-containing protein [Microbacterium sp. SSW1-49]|uniref:Glycerophosphoryl diester phosphodiesterase membrane domain-containing protein n=1 Tax=Microbacterium croceum TaxID=2851645 RepID=A0ABT0FE68_9MICO|nr:glycerophosphoryl diester phosphodiesterase membrane domain-containing protein [Microbacterium croceum]MCK2036354.1 glycerophosphoryl diester phosphodiesterase membrane domain-containing protein [Microbacterium croceum]